MKKVLVMAAIIVINFVFQTSLYNFVDIFGIPNISLILVVIFSMMTNSFIGGILGLLTGYLYDTMLYDVFGIYTLIYFIIGSLIGTFSDEINRENYILYCGITAISTLLVHFLLFIILYFLKYDANGINRILWSLLIEVLLNTVVTILILKFIVFIFNKLDIE